MLLPTDGTKQCTGLGEEREQVGEGVEKIRNPYLSHGCRGSSPWYSSMASIILLMYYQEQMKEGNDSTKMETGTQEPRNPKKISSGNTKPHRLSTQPSVYFQERTRKRRKPKRRGK